MGKGDPIGDGGLQPVIQCPMDVSTLQAMPCNARLAIIAAIPTCAYADMELCDAGGPIDLPGDGNIGK